MANSGLAEKYNKDPSYHTACEKKARDWAKANPSDPFAYAMAIKDLKSGAVHPTDDCYSVEWRREARMLQSPLSTGEPSFIVEVPTNMKRP